MTSPKRPGVYFQETVQSNIITERDQVPLFLVQTSTSIEAIDDKITHYTGFDAFKTLAENKGLAQTLTYIEQALLEYGNTEFYVFSIKTDTATAFTNAIKSTAHLTDINEVIYVEETASANANKITDKISAIKTGLIDNAANGVFRIGYIIPYGTVSAAVEGAGSGTTAEQACITSLTSVLTANGNGRICCVLPDENAGIIVGRCLSCESDEEPGYNAIVTSPQTSTYNFDNTQMITLQNLGVLFMVQENVQGASQYRINLGVTTGFKDNTADGLIVSRTIADDILTQIKFAGDAFVKGKEVESNVVVLQALTDGIVDDAVTRETIIRDGTSLVVSDTGNSSFTITGTIRPIRSIISIDVSTKLA